MKSIKIGANCCRFVNSPARTKSLKTILLSTVCVLALGFAPGLRGQATGSFNGNVDDKSGSAIPGASVAVTSQGTGLVRDTKTDGAGHYLIPLLPVGTYDIKVDAPGFQSAASKDLRLQVDEAREFDFTLSPASVTTTVTVSGEAVAVETTNPSLGQVITSQQVSQLPLNGRDFVQLATLTAGATAETSPGSFFNSEPPTAKLPRAVRTRCRWADRAPTARIGCLTASIIMSSRPAASAFSPRSTTFRSSRFSLTPTPPNTARAPDLPFWSRRNRERTTSTARSMTSCATPTFDARGDFDTSTREVQPEPVRRLRRRPHSEEQDLLLRRWRAEVQA